jgi:hypothetical protein
MACTYVHVYVRAIGTHVYVPWYVHVYHWYHMVAPCTAKERELEPAVGDTTEARSVSLCRGRPSFQCLVPRTQQCTCRLYATRGLAAAE